MVRGIRPEMAEFVKNPDDGGTLVYNAGKV
jgi:hypothetical protein